MMSLSTGGADSRELIKEVYFAMKMQISLLSAWSPLWYSPGQGQMARPQLKTDYRRWPWQQLINI